MSIESNNTVKSKQSPASIPQPLAMTLKISASLSRLLILLLAAFITVVITVSASSSLTTLEERVGTLGWTLSPEETPEERLAIIAIDEKSLSQIGPWPWPREVLATLSTAIKDAGASLQIYDVVLPEAKPGDAVLLNALTDTNSILGQIPVFNTEQPLQTGTMSGHLPTNRCHPAIPSTQHYLASHAGFSSINKGHITPIVDTDGMVRTVPPLVCVEGKTYPSLALSTLMTALGVDRTGVHIESEQGLLSPPYTLKFIDYPGFSIPLNKDGGMRISYKQSPESFQVISAVDLLTNDIDAPLLSNTWALVGATAFGLGDIIPTPHSGVTPGVELQARLISGLLDNQTPYTPRLAPLLLLCIAALFGLVLLMLARAQGKLSTFGLPTAGLIMPAAAILLHTQLLEFNLWLGWIAPALFAISAAVLLSVLEHGRVRMERIRVYDNLSSYLPNKVAVEIAFNLPSGAVEAERRELTILSADIRNFSAFEESRPPEESAALLHCFFVQTAAIIEKYGGNIQEFKGDSLLAVWDNRDQSNSALNALNAATELQNEQHSILPTTPPPGLEALALGIGIEQGPTLVGSIGPAHRRTHTILGDTVTIALRIQEMTAELAQPILIGECAARHLDGSEIQSQGAYLLDGLRTPHTLFAPLNQETAQYEAPEYGGQTFKVVNGGKR